MENKLTLEHLAPYLPYGLNMTFNLPNNPNQTGKLLSLGTTLDGYLTANVQLSDTEARQIRFSKSSKDSLCKPILRPMGYLGKKFPATVVGIRYVDEINKKSMYSLDKYGDFYDLPESMGASDIWENFEGLFKFHFDVFGLIDKGLAIDINTLQK